MRYSININNNTNTHTSHNNLKKKICADYNNGTTVDYLHGVAYHFQLQI